MEVSRTSNVREGPGLNFDILFTLQADAPLMGLAYKNQWVRVRDDRGRSGWIFHALVRGSDR
jgi:SH3-like domain-containing protein